MKTVIHSGVIVGAAELSPGYDAMAEKLEHIFSEYLDDTKALPEAVEECEVSVTFADSDQIAEMNSEYREVVGPTDVLSFPMWENEEGGFEPPDDWNTLPLGDIVVCQEIVAKNAADNGKSAESETALVICHGFLHLLGFDHAEEDERREMWRIQDSFVDKYFGTERDDG